MFSYLKGFNVLPRGSQKQFPVQPALDGTPCILASPQQPVGQGETIIVFPIDPATTVSYPSPVEGKNLCSVKPGDFLSVYTVIEDGTMLQSFRIDCVQPETLTATLVDTLIISQ